MWAMWPRAPRSESKSNWDSFKGQFNNHQRLNVLLSEKCRNMINTLTNDKAISVNIGWVVISVGTLYILADLITIVIDIYVTARISHTHRRLSWAADGWVAYCSDSIVLASILCGAVQRGLVLANQELNVFKRVSIVDSCLLWLSCSHNRQLSLGCALFVLFAFYPLHCALTTTLSTWSICID